MYEKVSMHSVEWLALRTKPKQTLKPNVVPGLVSSCQTNQSMSVWKIAVKWWWWWSGFNNNLYQLHMTQWPDGMFHPLLSSNDTSRVRASRDTQNGFPVSGLHWSAQTMLYKYSENNTTYFVVLLFADPYV